MFAGASMPVDRPSGWRSNSFQHEIRSATTSPANSRSNSFSSITSAQTDPGLESQGSRQSSLSSAQSTASSKSGLRSIFSSKGQKKKKSPKDGEKIVLTSRHAATVKYRMMTDPRLKRSTAVKTAGVVGTVHTGHMTAAEQEARHPHSGPPAVHAKAGDMACLTRIVSGDERDEEDELTKLQNARLEWEAAKLSSFARVREYHDASTAALAEQSPDEEQVTHLQRDFCDTQTTSTDLAAGRAISTVRNAYGGRFHRNEHGKWTR